MGLKIINVIFKHFAINFIYFYYFTFGTSINSTSEINVSFTSPHLRPEDNEKHCGWQRG